jgi:hypothetical protein
MFANRAEPDARCSGLLLRESAAVIFQAKLDRRAVGIERKRKTSGAGMLYNVGDAFLGAPVKRDFGGMRRFGRERPNIDNDLQTVSQPARLNEAPKRFFDRKPLPIRWMQTVRDGSNLFDRLFRQVLQTHQSLLSSLGQYTRPLAEHIQIQFDTGKRLPRSGVQFASDSRPFTLQFTNQDKAGFAGFAFPQY